jgi:hypothetical protein
MFSIEEIEDVHFECSCGFQTFFDDEARIHVLAMEDEPGHDLDYRVVLRRIPVLVDLPANDERGTSEE